MKRISRIGRKSLASWIITISTILVIGSLLLSNRVPFTNNLQELFPSQDALPALNMSNPPANTPIKHIVIMMQENHAFDNYFGVFPGLLPEYALDLNTCMPVNPANPSEGCLKPFNADTQTKLVESYDLIHAWTASEGAFDRGKMNGFIEAQVKGKVSYPNFTMAYYTNATVPNYWDLASYYALDANFYSGELSYTMPNHFYLIAGQSGGFLNKPDDDFDYTFPTIINELVNKDISWRYYSFGWNDSLDCVPMTVRTFESATIHSNIYQQPLINFPAVQQNTSAYFGNNPVCDGLASGTDLLQNLSNGWLPQVSWIMMNQTGSEHPHTAGPYGVFNGQQYTAYVIDKIEENPALWNNTAIFLTYDEWGGYYDSVRPNQVDAYGFGFRLPLIVISPWVQPGKIFYGSPLGQQEDVSALLTTIEENWGLSPLTQRDANDPSLFYMFNFTQSPLPPLFLPLASNLGVNSNGQVEGSLAVYPYQSCVAKGLCSIGGTGPSFVAPSGPASDYSHLPSFLNLSSSQLAQEANFSGDGDPFD